MTRTSVAPYLAAWFLLIPACGDSDGATHSADSGTDLQPDEEGEAVMDVAVEPDVQEDLTDVSPDGTEADVSVPPTVNFTQSLAGALFASPSVYPWVAVTLGTTGLVTQLTFHVVFTLPSQLRPLALRNGEVVFPILLRGAAEVLSRLGEQRLGAQLGVTTVLHTWTRTMQFHPHVHCVVTGGGLALGGEAWKPQARPRVGDPDVQLGLDLESSRAPVRHRRRAGAGWLVPAR
ncbi:MAG: transposase, partial [Planctomycetota bacterium]|nr:transposase [Planctomycetota bacterium]